MHFWIDKRSQTCGFSGRHRIPPSLSTGCNNHHQQQRRRRRRSRGKLMVTPVHRFQPIESTAIGRRNLHHQRQLHNYLPPGYVTSPPRHSSAHSAELDSSVFLDIPLTSNGEVPPRDSPPRLYPTAPLRYGIWASFFLATVFVAGVKIYFDRQVGGYGFEALVFFSLMVVFVLAGCTASLYRSKLRWDLLAATVPPSQAPISAATSNDIEVVIDEEVPPPVPPSVPPPIAPPPPYHIAILLPQEQPAPLIDESPPPTYDKAVG